MRLEDLLRQAELLSDLRRYDEAEPLLGQVLAADPEHHEALCLLARGLVAQDRYEEAETIGRRVLAAHPDSARGLVSMARIQWLCSRPRDGISFARKAVELYPDEPRCLLTLADVLNAVWPGSAEALQLIEAAIGLEPEDPFAHALAGDVHLAVAQYSAAETCTLRALRIRPDDPDTVLQLGLIRAGLGRFAESREQVRMALRMDPTPQAIESIIEHVECRAVPEHLAELYRMMLGARGRPDLTRPGASGGEPELIAAQGALAARMYSLHAGPDGRRRAGALAASVLRDDPDDADARYVWSRTLSDREEYEAALVLAEQLVAEGHPHAHDALLVTHSGLGDHEAALATIERALAAEPDAPMYLRGKAFCLRFLDRPREALAVARYAARISPATPDLQLQLGLAARTVGDVAAAEHALRLAVEQAPGTGEPVAELAVLYVDAERWDDAEELMDRLRPDLPDPRETVLAASTLATAYLQRAFPALGELDEDDPAPGPLAVAAGLLGRAIDMYAVAAVGYSGGPAAFAELIAEVHSVLHEVAAPADSSFAAVVRRLDALVHTWRSGRPYESDIVEELS